MSTPSAGSSVGAAGATQLRPATTTDLAAICELEDEAFTGRQRWSPRSWAEELAAENRVVRVRVADTSGAGQIAGESRVAGVITVQHVGEVAELNRIIVAPDHRGRGIGDELLTAGMAAVAEDCLEMLLEVRHDNAPALGLYARHGFVEIARRTDYYGAGVDALILRRELEWEPAAPAQQPSTPIPAATEEAR